MDLPRFDHVGLVVDDLEAAERFFALIGFEREGAFDMSGELLDRILALDDVRTHNVMLKTPDGVSRVELSHYERSEPAMDAAPPNRLGTPHVCFQIADLGTALDALRGAGYETVGEVVEYEGVYRLVYVRGPESLIVELAERLG